MLVHSHDKEGACCYMIQCSGNGKIYIGSTVDYQRRIHTGHLLPLRKGTHPNKHLQAAWDQYGPYSFLASPLVWLPRDKKILLDIEGKLIQSYSSSDHKVGFNICKDPSHSTAGVPLSEEHREKLRQAKLGKKRGPYGPRKKETKPRKSRGPLSEEHKQKLREKNAGRKLGSPSEETRDKQRLSAIERWKDPSQRENQALNLKKQKEIDPELSSRGGRKGAQSRWGCCSDGIKINHEGEV